MSTSIARRALPAISLVAVSALALAACGNEPTDTAAAASEGGAGEEVTSLTFATPPGTDNPDTLAELEILGEILGEVTDLEIRQEIPADYLGVVEALRQGHVDVALLSPFATALAISNGSVDPLVTWAASDEPASFCYAQAGSDITTIDDVAGRSVAFVDPGSTTGYFMPAALLADNGLVDGVDFESQFAGGHDSAMLALANGSVDVACTSILDMLIDAGAMAAEDFQQIGATGPIPVGISVVVSPHMDADMRQHLLETVPDRITDNDELSILGGNTNPMLDPGLTPYEPLLGVAESVGLNLEDMR